MVSPHLRRKMKGHVPLVVIFFQSDTFPKIEKCAMMFNSTAIALQGINISHLGKRKIIFKKIHFWVIC